MAAFQTVRIKVDSTDYSMKLRLPKETSNWIIINEGTGDVRWATNDKPPDYGERAWVLIGAKSAFSPPIVPAFVGEPVELWLRTDAASSSINVTVVYTTSKDPRVIAHLSSMSYGVAGDFQLGAVEVKDGSGDQRVTITSGPDGVKYIETDTSGASVNIGSGVVGIAGADGTRPTVTSGADGIARLEVSAQITSAEIQIGAVELKDGSSETRVTVTSGGDGVNYIETDMSGARFAIFGPSGGITAEVANANNAYAGVGGGLRGLVTTSILHAYDGTSLSLPVRGTSGPDGVVYIETDSSGSAHSISTSGVTVDGHSGVRTIAYTPAATGLPIWRNAMHTASVLYGRQTDAPGFLLPVDVADLAQHVAGGGVLTSATALVVASVMVGDLARTGGVIAGATVSIGSSTDGVRPLETDTSGSDVGEFRTTDASGAMTSVSGVGQLIIAANASRREVTLRNISGTTSAVIYLGFTSGVTTSNAPVVLNQNDSYTTAKYTGVWYSSIASGQTGVLAWNTYGG